MSYYTAWRADGRRLRDLKNAREALRTNGRGYAEPSLGDDRFVYEDEISARALEIALSVPSENRERFDLLGAEIEVIEKRHGPFSLVGALARDLGEAVLEEMGD